MCGGVKILLNDFPTLTRRRGCGDGAGGGARVALHHYGARGTRVCEWKNYRHMQISGRLTLWKPGQRSFDLNRFIRDADTKLSRTSNLLFLGYDNKCKKKPCRFASIFFSIKPPIFIFKRDPKQNVILC